MLGAGRAFISDGTQRHSSVVDAKKENCITFFMRGRLVTWVRRWCCDGGVVWCGGSEADCVSVVGMAWCQMMVY